MNVHADGADRADTLRMIDEAARAFAAPDPSRTRAVRDRANGFDAAAWDAMAGLGWFGVAVPADRGGLGLGAAEAATLVRRLGYGGRQEPVVGAALMPAICLAASGDVAAPLLLSIVDGSVRACVAWQPGDGRFDAGRCGFAMAADESPLRIDGTARFVDGAAPDVLVIAARQGEETVLVQVARDHAGLHWQDERAADGTCLARVRAEGLHPASDAVLARGEVAVTALAAAIDWGVLLTAAELLGTTERALDLTLEHLRVREQFGRPIGAFQALQHRAVDMWIQKELTRAALAAAVRCFDDPSADVRARSAAASSAKARASHAALHVCGQAVQLHGAIGFTDEHELGLHVNRAMVLAARLGNAAEHRRRHAGLVRTEGR